MTSQFAVTADRVMTRLNMCSVGLINTRYLLLSTTAQVDFPCLNEIQQKTRFYYLLTDFFNRDAVTDLNLP